MSLFSKQSALRKIDALQQKFESETGLCILRMQTAGQLDIYLNKGLIRLYKDVFGGAPYFEKFSEAEVRDCFQEFLKRQGQIFLAVNPADDKPVAFIVSVPLRNEFNMAAFAKRNGIGVRNAAYLAEDGVDASFRRGGLSARMKALLLETCKMEGFSKVLVRTSAQNYPQISAINKAGGRVVRGVLQNVDRTRLDGTTTNDVNAFYIFDRRRGLSALFNPVAAGIKKVENVSIVRMDGKDIMTIPAKYSKELYDDLRHVYPGAADISFADVQPSAGETIFKGSMYLAGRARL